MRGVVHSKKTRTAVLTAYRKLGRIDLATAAVGVDRGCHYDWLKKYPEYAAEFEQTGPEVAGLIEDLVKSRAFEGVLEPVFSGGKQAMMFARDENGELLREPCPTCEGTGVVKHLDQPACPSCGGSGKSKKFVAMPAMVRKLSDACLLALAEARVPGFNRKHAIVNKDSEDRDYKVIVEYEEKPIPE